MLKQLLPEDGVPDTIFIAALKAAITPSEMAFRDILRFHRDFLNGGFDQVLFNISSRDEHLPPYLAAYRLAGLHDEAQVIEQAKALFDAEDDLDELEDHYVRLTYGPDNKSPDAVEAAAVRFAQRNEESFESVLRAAS